MNKVKVNDKDFFAQTMEQMCNNGLLLVTKGKDSKANIIPLPIVKTYRVNEYRNYPEVTYPFFVRGCRCEPSSLFVNPPLSYREAAL